MLIAGYGKTAPDSDFGVLRAGYNEWSVSNYSQPSVAPDYQAALKMLSYQRYGVSDSLILLADRITTNAYVNTAGKRVSTDLTFGGTQKSSVAHALQGDSGGPAFAFDVNKNPFVVGVTSLATPMFLEIENTITVLDASSMTSVFSVSLAEDDAGKVLTLEQAMKKMNEFLLTSKYVDASENVLRNFTLVTQQKRIAASHHASLLSEKNAEFVTQNLTRLEKVRNAANYCQ